MDLETTWYEVSPYVYGLAGLISLLIAANPIAIAAGVLLLAGGFTILHLRWKNRRKTSLLKTPTETPLDPSTPTNIVDGD